jgi:hypothetical protein
MFQTNFNPIWVHIWEPRDLSDCCGGGRPAIGHRRSEQRAGSPRLCAAEKFKVVPKQDKLEAAGANAPFTERDIREAARLLRLIASLDDTAPRNSLGPDTEERQPQTVDREVLLSRAKKHLRDRQVRRHYFNRAIFGEPAWDTLIVLYISEFFGRSLTVGKLVSWIEAPLSTTQRWIAYLEKERLVAKEGHPDDKRMAYVRLLDKGRTILDEYFSAVA